MEQEFDDPPALNEPSHWLKLLPVPDGISHKYSRGHVVVQGGGREHTGAARLAARAALRTGAGAVTVACNEASLAIYAAAFEAVMTHVAEDEAAFQALIEDARVSALLIGPAAGVTEQTRRRVLAALRLHKPSVLDADALTVFADDPQALFAAIRATPCVLTPHEGEFARLFPHFDTTDRTARARMAASASGAVVLLKGAVTVIAAPDGRSVLNTVATPYLATAGSGDVLAGIISGLLAGGMHAFEAACAGAWIHGKIGKAYGVGLISEDIPDLVPGVLHSLHGRDYKGEER